MKKSYEKPLATVGYYSEVLTSSADPYFDESKDNGTDAIGSWWEINV